MALTKIKIVKLKIWDNLSWPHLYCNCCLCTTLAGWCWHCQSPPLPLQPPPLPHLLSLSPSSRPFAPSLTLWKNSKIPLLPIAKIFFGGLSAPGSALSLRLSIRPGAPEAQPFAILAFVKPDMKRFSNDVCEAQTCFFENSPTGQNFCDMLVTCHWHFQLREKV